MRLDKKEISVITIDNTDDDTVVRFDVSANHYVTVIMVDGNVVVEGKGTFSVVPGKHNIILTPKRS